MERVDHVHIVQIGCGSLVGDVHRMLQGQVPYREGLELGVTSTDATLVFIVELRETSSHLTASRTRSRYNHQWTRSLHVVVLAKALVAGDELHIVGIAIDGVVEVRLDTLALQAMTELISSMLSVVVGNHYRAYEEVATHELITQTKHILVVGDAQVSTYLVLLDILSADHNENLDAVAQLTKHAELGVGLETRQHARCMVIIEQLTTQLHIQFSVELGDALADML